MSEREVLVKRIHDRKIQAYEYGRSLSNIPEDQLKHYGYQTRAAALMAVFKDAESEIEKHIREYERRFPNER